MKINYIEALKLAATKNPKPPSDAINQIVAKVEKIRREVKLRSNPA